MASDNTEPLKILLIHGAKNYSLSLNPSENDKSDIDVRQLAEEAERLTGIPKEKQKLIFKGRTLTTDSGKQTGLQALGLKNGSKVMVLGSKLPPTGKTTSSHSGSSDREFLAADNELRSPLRGETDKLQVFESSLDKEASSLARLMEEIDIVNSKSPVSKKGQRKLEQAQKQLMVSVEGFMQLLESIDSLQLNAEDSASRTKRKHMVDRIQKLMDQCEKLAAKLKDTVMEK